MVHLKEQSLLELAAPISAKIEHERLLRACTAQACRGSKKIFRSIDRVRTHACQQDFVTRQFLSASFLPSIAMRVASSKLREMQYGVQHMPIQHFTHSRSLQV